MAEYKAQLIAVEAKLAKDPENEELLSLKEDLIELIELSSSIEEDEEKNKPPEASRTGGSGSTRATSKHDGRSTKKSTKSESCDTYVDTSSAKPNGRVPLSEAELLAKKKEKNRRKKAKLREKIKVQLDVAESEKQSWQSFASKKGLKGVTKKSIFASPCSVNGKVGVGTNGIADAPKVAASTTGANSSVGASKRKY